MPTLGVTHGVCFVALLLVGACAQPPVDSPPLAPLAVHDVSILFPLPRTGAELGLLPLTYSAGARGELLPRSLYDRLPLLLAYGGPSAVFGSLRVVAVRLDPCFPGVGPDGPAPCRSQVRVVFQPIAPGFDGDPAQSTDDAALHVFYALDRAELDAMARELSALRAAAGPPTDGGRLGPHPVIAREGLDGPFARGVRASLLRHAGSQNLSRITFMALQQFREQWMFGGFDVARDGTLTPLRIPATDGATQQVFINLDPTGAGYDHGSAIPRSRSVDDPSAFYSSRALLDMGADAQREAYRRVLSVENTQRHSPDTVDCVSCHTATPARVWAERALGLRPEQEPDRYDASGAAVASAGESETSTRSLRAFGYLGRTPAISRRTANESAAVAAELNRALPR